ncbi:MAG: IS200/IS605 family transposase [Candidatus Kapabacteria bacterium]|nr:IS200/IS605 family transposase [Candidatus Kapabacteria bacterium]
MSQSLSQMYIHLVFTTKNRFPFISNEIENSLHSYISGILKNLESTVISINSTSDHIHILFKLSKNLALAKVVEETKKHSSKWMKEQGVLKFSWQAGYGAFSVSSSKLKVVIKYIQNQKEHHRVKSFEEEIDEFMNEYNVKEYDPKYFLD